MPGRVKHTHHIWIEIAIFLSQRTGASIKLHKLTTNIKGMEVICVFVDFNLCKSSHENCVNIGMKEIKKLYDRYWVTRNYMYTPERILEKSGMPYTELTWIRIGDKYAIPK